MYDKFISLSYNNINSSLRESTEGDRVREYAVQLLRLGCFYQEYSDAIREGDGGRVLHCWKYMIYWLYIYSNDDSIPILEWK